MTTANDETSAEGPLLRGLSAAVAAVDAVRESTTWQATDLEVLHGIRRVAELRAKVDAVYLELIRELDERGVATTSPVATTVEGFIRTTCLVGAGQARKDVAAARATAPGSVLEPFGIELAEGQSSRAHIDIAVTCMDRIPQAVATRPGAQQTIVTFLQRAAMDAAPVDMDRAARQLLARLDPDRRDRFDPEAHERRFFDLHTDSTGMLIGRLQLDAVSGAALRTALDRCSAPLPGADGEPDRRQPRQRRADALTTLAEMSLGVAEPRRGERPRVVVHVTPEQLRGTSAGLGYFEGGDPIRTQTAQRLSCDAVIQRLLMCPSAGPLNVGRTLRLVTASQRVALAARDGGCVIPGCGAQPDWCDAHHVLHWADGGATDLVNLVLLCPGHHTAVHAGSWEVCITSGAVLVVPPRWVDPTRTPRRVWHRRVQRTLNDLDEAAPP